MLQIKKDDLKWDYNTSTKTIVISGKGMMKSYLEDEPEWNYLSEEAEKIIINDEVTTIGDGAFMYFTNIKEFGDYVIVDNYSNEEYLEMGFTEEDIKNGKDPQLAKAQEVLLKKIYTNSNENMKKAEH